MKSATHLNRIVTLILFSFATTPQLMAQGQNLEQLPKPQLRVESRPLEVRIKDITRIEGVQTHVLRGYGLVTGLSETGATLASTRDYALAVFQSNDNIFPADARATFRTSFKTSSLSVVEVTAELPAFAFEGQRVDVKVSVFDDATSLEGGTLSLAYLKGEDGEEYASASGSILVGGFSRSGDAASITKNNVKNGKIVLGGMIRKKLCQPKLGAEGYVDFHVRNQDRMTAVRVAEAINKRFPRKAQIVEGQAIRVIVPISDTQSQMEKFLSEIQELRVIPDTTAKVIVDLSSGTIVITENATLRPTVVSVGNLTIATSETPQVTNGAPFGGGTTTVTPQTDLAVNEDENVFRYLPGNRSLRDLVDSLNALGLSAQEMSNVLRTINASGALQAKLVFQ